MRFGKGKMLILQRREVNGAVTSGPMASRIALILSRRTYCVSVKQVCSVTFMLNIRRIL